MKKLQLHRETLVRLSDEDQLLVQGGLRANESNGLCPISNNTKCPTEQPWCMKTSAGCNTTK